MARSPFSVAATLCGSAGESLFLHYPLTGPAGTQLYLFLFFQALYALTASGNVGRVPDELEVYFQVEHFVDEGDLSVPQTFALRQPVVVDGKVVGSTPIFFGKIGRDKKPYAPYGPLAALLTIVHHLAARAIALALGVTRMPLPEGLAWLYLVGALTSLATSTAAALAVVGFHRAAIALGSPGRLALALSMLLGAGTALWVYGASLYSEAFVAAALIWAAALLIEARAQPASGRSRVSIAAFLLVIAGLTKPTALVIAPAFVLGALTASSVPRRARTRIALVLAAGAAVATVIHLAWNTQRFGDPLDFGYDCCDTVPVRPFRPFAADELPRGLIVLLASPGKSLLLWAPPLLLALARFRAVWRTDRALASGLAMAACAALVFYGSYMFPEGGYSHGPRHLVPLIPLLLLPAAHPSARSPSRGAMLATGAVGAAVALLAVTVSYLQDQTLGVDLAQSGRTAYYEKIDPAAGRPWNRYALGYVPFVRTLTAPSWTGEGQPGLGPDFMPYLLNRVRESVRDGREIPAWFPYAMPVPWILLLGWSAIRLLKAAHTREVP